jgi:toxin ParE1/3/4
MTERPWGVRLGAVAEVDFANIIRWTTQRFGSRQARIYREMLLQTIAELKQGLGVAGSKARDEITPGARTLHMARHGRRGRHFLLYRVADPHVIEIGRISHDQMDLTRHVPSAWEL